MKPDIAIVASTRNRPESMRGLVESLQEFMPDKAIFMIVDDASDESYAYPDFRFNERSGISHVKNKCMQLAYESGADHIFLIDDDIRFLKKDWHLPYINSGEHHLCATFLPKHGSFTNILEFPNDLMESHIKTHLLGNGYCLYFTRHCIETVGGFDTNYNNKYEHCDLSRRIYNARLTDNIYQDIKGSDKLIYCLDQDNKIQRSFTNREMQDNLKAGYEYFRSREGSSEYIEFRT